MKRSAIAIIVVALLAVSAPARAERRRIRVRVADVAGDTAYVTPCAEAGLRVGSEIRFRGRGRRKVKVASADHCAVPRGEKSLRVGARGVAVVEVEEEGGATERAEPPPPSVYEGTWPEAAPPARFQSPEPVPLGVALDFGSYRVSLIATSGSIVPLGARGEPLSQMALGARVRAEPWSSVPLGFDADIAAALWLGPGVTNGLADDSRPLFTARELRLRYGGYARPLVGVGRLRYAAATVGLLDGVRVRTPSWRGASVAAFGGLVPDPLSGRPSTDVARFGVEAHYERPDVPLRPVLDLVATGSQFDGALDERRASLRARLFPGGFSLMAGADVSGFDDENPWGRNPVELTWAGLDARYRWDGGHVGGRLDYRQPERSYFLAAVLPQSWLCTADPRPPGTAEPCAGFDDARHVASADGGLDLGPAALFGGVSLVGTSHDASENLAGFADLWLPRMFGAARTSFGVSGTTGTFLDTAALRARVGAPMGRDLDLSVFYRPALLSYSAATALWLEHRGGIDVGYNPRPTLDVLVSLEGTSGPDAAALAAFTTAVWRPPL